jgi:hypothetical protein
MAEVIKYDLEGQEGIQIWTDLPEGTKLTLTDGSKGVITANPRDGGFVQIEYVEHPNNPSMVGQEEFIFFNQVSAAES